MRALACRLASLALLAAILLVAASAAAHDVGLSQGEYALAGGVLTVRATFAQPDLLGLARGLDGDGDGAVSGAELAAGRAMLAEALLPRILVHGGGAACAGSLDDARSTSDGSVALVLRYRCPGAPRQVTVDFALIDDLASAHRHLARIVTAGGVADVLVSRQSQSFSVASEAGAPGDRGLLAFFRMGVEHILGGYDHLVFLVGLVIVGGRWRSMLLVVTAFTVAHSLTLALAALGVWAPGPRLVEPAIALSIAYVGVENFFVHDVARRWRITFPFGMIHGFGFAGALREAAVARADVPAALLLFNLGVEAGQLAVLAAILPVLVLLQRATWFRERGVKVVSAAIVAAGLAWFVARVR